MSSDYAAEYRELQGQLHELRLQNQQYEEFAGQVRQMVADLINQVEAPQSVIRFLSQNELIRRCHYCRSLANTKDHIVPLAMGGTDKSLNLVPACWDCNQNKADKITACRCVRCTYVLAHHIIKE